MSEDGFEPMETFPKDGTVCDLLCCSVDRNTVRVIVKDIKWSRYPIGDRWGLTGRTNNLSSYLVPLGWRLPLKEEGK